MLINNALNYFEIVIEKHVENATETDQKNLQSLITLKDITRPTK
jgi:hypothetical protein